MFQALNPTPLRVLVVDDHKDAAESLQMLASMWGYEVRVAYNGKEALQTATTFHPDVVLLDIRMPRMDGYAVARAIRETPGLDKVLLIATTGYATAADKQRSTEAGFDHHLVKPYSPEYLEHLLAETAASRQCLVIGTPSSVATCSETKIRPRWLCAK